MNYDLLRLSLALDSKAQNTIDKYICKLAEEVIFDSKLIKVNSLFLVEEINEKYNLEFDITEVETAIVRRGKGIIIIHDDNYYSLHPKRSVTLSEDIDLDSKLSVLIDKYTIECQKDIDKENLRELLKKYLYFSLNSSISNLLSLISNNSSQVSLDFFNATSEEVALLNSFITWDNDDKSKLLYTIVSFSYEYCMLSTKKNNLLSKDIFKGKRFYLDSNLIFRMAGINKTDRKFVMESFMRKCKEVDIELIYTNETLSEITRVISANISYIKHLTLGQEPISHTAIDSIDDFDSVNDFYDIYELWCHDKMNNYDDFISFQKYLNDLVFSVLRNLKCISIPNYQIEKDKKEFENYCISLKKFKDEKRPKRKASKESVKNDMNNIFYVLFTRNQYSDGNIFQTNDFFVSADQVLISWSKKNLKGVPVVVIPSVWLSIILRLTGRSPDDYRSFCLFLTLRQHNLNQSENSIDLKLLLPSLARKTIRKNIKEAIISELVSNVDQYNFEDENDYDLSVDKAFDIVVEKLEIQNSEKIADEVLKKDIEFQKYEETHKQEIIASNLETISNNASTLARKSINKWGKITKYVNLIGLGLTIIFCTLLIFMYVKMEWFKENISFISIFISLSAFPFWRFLRERILYLSSEERYNKLHNKFIALLSS